MKKIFKLIILVFLFSNCQQKKECNLNVDILKSNDSILSKIKSDGILKKNLNKIKEPELENLKRETYRFMIMSSFGDYQIYRVNKNYDNYDITFKNYTKNIYDPITYEKKFIDSLSKESSQKISENDWFEIKENLDELNFWQLPINTNESYLDGVAYIIEAYNLEKNVCTERNYHATSRISPNDTTKYKLLFKKIIKLTKKEVEF